MIDFEKEQAYADKQEGQAWHYVASLNEGESVEIYLRDGIKSAKYLGVLPRNRKYPIILDVDGVGRKASPDCIMLPGDKEEALTLYLDNLWRRHKKEAFGGLPTWQRLALDKCEEVLPDELCEACKVPNGSTVGHSVRHGKHYADLSMA